MTTAAAIVVAVLEELRGRRGFRHLLEEIELDDPETFIELREALELAVTVELGRVDDRPH